MRAPYPMLNALMVYNPRNRQYYKPKSYRFDSYWLPGSVYPALHYDGGLFCSLLCDDNPPIEEKYPPGTRVERINPKTNMILAGTVMDIPLPLDPSGNASIPNETIFSIMGLRLQSLSSRWLVSFCRPLSMLMTLTPLLLSCLSFSG
jgi:hypothetical protein